MAEVRIGPSGIASEPMRYVHGRLSDLGREEHMAIVRGELERLREIGGEWTLRPLDERITMPMTPFEESLLELTVGPLFDTFFSFGFKAQSDQSPYNIFFGRPYVNVPFLRETFIDMPEIVDLIVTSGPSADFRMEIHPSWPVIRLGLAVLPKVFTVESEWLRLESMLNRHFDRLESIDIEACDFDTLRDILEDVISPISKVAKNHFQSILISEILFQLLKEFLGIHVNQDHEAKTLRLFGGSIDNVTVRTNLELSGLAEVLKGCPRLQAIISADDFSYTDMASAALYSAREQELMVRLDEFLAKYGHRDPVHSFMYPSWKEDPSTLLSVVNAMAMSDTETFTEGSIKHMNDLKVQTEKDITSCLVKGLGRLRPLRLLLFALLLKYARAYMSMRENQQFAIGRGFPIARRTLLQLGDILSKDGMLESSNEIFFIRRDEILSEDIRSLLEEEVDILDRMTRFHAFCSIEQPMVLRGEEEGELLDRFFAPRPDQDLEIISGIGASTGSYEGKARIIMDPEDLDTLEEGEVLVCPTTNPAWTPVFSMAGAIVTDIGGMLSHGAVVAREFGIPAVLGTGTATKRIETGDLVEVDGESGTVRILPTQRPVLEK